LPEGLSCFIKQRHRHSGGPSRPTPRAIASRMTSGAAAAVGDTTRSACKSRAVLPTR
jgi:hypothetical protein